ncbi:MAG: hypothetical protein EON92_03475 [Burkholderiales bacterium]|nr:MAG: hypothetical protein EON92_03475 [Burkholderiales bacterium]
MQRMAQREAYLPTAFPSTMPPAVADNGMVGGANGNVVAYAFANHTHNSKQRRERVVLTQTGIVTWTYATPYPEGSLPIVQGTPEVLADASQPLVACLVGRPTATQAQFFVYRAQTQTLGGTLAALLGVVVNVFAPAPIGAALHCTAVVP